MGCRHLALLCRQLGCGLRNPRGSAAGGGLGSGGARTRLAEFTLSLLRPRFHVALLSAAHFRLAPRVRRGTFKVSRALRLCGETLREAGELGVVLGERGGGRGDGIGVHRPLLAQNPVRRRRRVELSVQLGAVCTQRVGIGGGCVEVATEAVLAAARGGALLTQNFLVPQTRHLHLVLLL